MTADFGPDVTSKPPKWESASTITIEVNVAKTASGPQTLVLMAPDCSVATKPDAIRINGGRRVAPAPRKRRAPARPEPPEPPVG